MKAIKQVDVVISTLGHHDLEFKEMANQTKIIAAIKEVGTVKVKFSLNYIMVLLSGDLRFLWKS